MSAVLSSLPLPWRKREQVPEQEPVGKLLDLNAIVPAFVPGPYVKSNGQCSIQVDMDGEYMLVGLTFQGITSKIAPAASEATAHLFKASTSLFDVALATARLADAAYKLPEHELRQRLAALADPAEIALMRAMGQLG